MSPTLGVNMKWEGWGAEYGEPCIIGNLEANNHRVASCGYYLDDAGAVQPWHEEDDWNEELYGPQPPPPEGLVRVLRRQVARQAARRTMLESDEKRRRAS